MVAIRLNIEERPKLQDKPWARVRPDLRQSICQTPRSPKLWLVLGCCDDKAVPVADQAIVRTSPLTVYDAAGMSGGEFGLTFFTCIVDVEVRQRSCSWCWHPWAAQSHPRILREKKEGCSRKRHLPARKRRWSFDAILRISVILTPRSVQCRHDSGPMCPLRLQFRGEFVSRVDPLRRRTRVLNHC